MNKILILLLLSFISTIYSRPKFAVRSGTETLLSDFTNATVWRITNGSGIKKDTAMDDAAHALLVSDSGGTTRVIDSFAAVDLSNTPIFKLRFWMNDTAAAASGNVFLVGFYNENALTNGYRYYFKLTNADISDNEKVRCSSGKFIEMAFTKADLGVTGSPNWAAIKALRIEVPAATGKRLKMVFSRFSAYTSPFSKGTIFFSFDDCYSSMMNVDSMFRNRNWYFSIFPSVNQFGTTGKITLANADTLSAHGHEWHTHAYNHLQFTTSTDSVVNVEIDSCQAYIKRIASRINSPNRMSFRSYRIGAYPSNGSGYLCSPHVDSLISNRLDFVRITGSWPSVFSSSVPTARSYLSTKGWNPGSNTFATIKNYIDSTMKYHLGFYLWYHQIKDSTAYNGTTASDSIFQKIVRYTDTAYVAKGDGFVKPLSQMNLYAPDSIIIKRGVTKTATSYSVVCSLSTDADSAKLYLLDSASGVWTKRDSSVMMAGGSVTNLKRTGLTNSSLCKFKVSALTNLGVTDSIMADTIRTLSAMRRSSWFNSFIGIGTF